MNLAPRLEQGLRAMDLELPDDQRDKLLALVDLLDRWNRAFNLTAVRDPAAMVERHLLDSLVVLPWLTDEDTLDVGTGPGLPGLVLAIVRPDQAFTLLDSNGKKTRFVRQAIMDLKIANAEVVQSRVEQYRNAFPQVISRAFAALPEMLELTGHLVAPGGRLLAMKGALTDLEQAGIPAPWQAQHHPLTVPGIDEPRQLVVLQRAERGEAK